MLAKRRIGLLGGSFNPAHAGHLHISKQALKRLQLDEVWWLVSPQNPLKSPAELADYDARLESAEAMAAADVRIQVLDTLHGGNDFLVTESLSKNEVCVADGRR